MRTIVKLAVAAGLSALVGCGPDVADSEPYLALLSERNTLAEDLAAADARVAELDELADDLAAADARITELEQEIVDMTVDQTIRDNTAAFDAAALHDDFLAFLAISLQYGTDLTAEEALCTASAIIDDPVARAAWTQPDKSDDSLDAAEGGIAIGRAIESCGLDFEDSFPALGDLTELTEACIAGDAMACNDLYWTSEPGSEEERIGGTCGNRFPSIEEAPESCVGQI